ncbi:hypothetical protein HELRODRAFT_194696, partial [Helobdella robusta]|uniref:Acidic fibroblast growth factor intracellular-binding protein n=1 Tax=Helobdella robusta TaxID=6412 RepID=T1FWC0_HELRO
MNTLIDVFVGNETLIDTGVYQLWLDGQTVENAAKIQQKKGTLLQFGATFEMLTNDIEDQYRTFKLLENYLKNPTELSYQLELQLAPEIQSQLIEKYYEFDTLVVREFIGRKLSTRLRNSLDDISDRTKISVRSCKRQFDNVKQVLKVVEDLPGSILNNIISNFLLSSHLAQQYAAMVFLNTNRFDLTKKKLSHLTFHDLVHCANVIMNSWSISLHDSKDGGDANDADLDRDFLQEVKEFKV